MLQLKTGVLHHEAALQTAGKFSKKITKFGFMAIIAAASVFTACKKENADAPDGLKLNGSLAVKNPTAGGSALTLTGSVGTVALSSTGGIYTVSNYFVDQGIYTHPDSVYHRPNGVYYFRFSENDNIIGASSTTPPAIGNDWDLSFGGTANAYLGKHSSVTLKAKDVAFASVTLSDWSTATTITPSGTSFGHDGFLSPGTPATWSDPTPSTITGWFNYYFDNHEVLPITNRTLLLSDNQDRVYALEITSVYANSTPVDGVSGFPDNYSHLYFRYKYLGEL